MSRIPRQDYTSPGHADCVAFEELSPLPWGSAASPGAPAGSRQEDLRITLTSVMRGYVVWYHGTVWYSNTMAEHDIVPYGIMHGVCCIVSGRWYMVHGAQHIQQTVHSPIYIVYNVYGMYYVLCRMAVWHIDGTWYVVNSIHHVMYGNLAPGTWYNIHGI